MTMPPWVLFDHIGTLLDPRPVASALPVADEGAVVLAPLHDAAVQGMVHTLSGDIGRFSAIFARHSSGSYRYPARNSPPFGRTADELMAGMPPFADSADAVALSLDVELHVGVLANSGKSEQICVSPAENMLVAAHWWDVTGDKRVGLNTAWVSAKEQDFMSYSPSTRRPGRSLLEVAQES